MKIHSFLHADTKTYTHVLVDTTTNLCAVIDPVLDYYAKSSQTHSAFSDKIIKFIQTNRLVLQYIIDTHVHADHLSAAAHVKRQLGGKLVIGKGIIAVQRLFKDLFNLDMRFKTDASQFDVLTEDASELRLGNIRITAMHVPGHTPADMAYVARIDTNDNDDHNNHDDNDDHDDHAENTAKIAVFVGDTLFAPDVGTARCDFPGGDAGMLYDSIQKILALPDATEIYLCHDYPPKSPPPSTQMRDYSPVTTVAAQKASNIHVHDGITRAAFIKMRHERDAMLEMPRLILPSVQVNIRAGELPEPEDNGIRYLKVPLNQFR